MPHKISTLEFEPVLIAAGIDAWRAIDPAFPHTDARCLLAYIERSGDRFMVLSLVPPVGGITEAASLEEARRIAARLQPHTRDVKDGALA